MRGVVKGEQTSASNPILQLFVRSGEFLTDFYSGTYKIDDIHSPSVATVNKVPQTAFTANEKLGTGRYYIPTGDTSAWTQGTHRVTCTYKLTASGATYTTSFEFELLDSGDWATGNQYTGYMSTRKLLADQYITSTFSISTAQRYLDQAAKNIERWCGRIFEPRYIQYRLRGSDAPLLMLPETVIAIEEIRAIWKIDANEEDSYLYDGDFYRVYNRHLDNGEDDRNNPKIARIDEEGLWPQGYQNFLIKGVFGYTEPVYDPLSGRTLIGTTPDDIGFVSAVLLSRQIQDPMFESPATHNPGAIQSFKTRDQSIAFNNAGAATRGAFDSLTGDSMLDQKLYRFMRPYNMAIIEDRYFTGSSISESEEFSG